MADVNLVLMQGVMDSNTQTPYEASVDARSIRFTDKNSTDGQKRGSGAGTWNPPTGRGGEK